MHLSQGVGGRGCEVGKGKWMGVGRGQPAGGEWEARVLGWVVLGGCEAGEKVGGRS